MIESRRWERDFLSRHVLLVLEGFVKSLFLVRPIERRFQYFRALFLAVVTSAISGQAVHPSVFLNGEVWVRFRGLEYLLDQRTVFGYYLHTFEPGTARRILSRSGDVFVDIGANTGQYVVPLAKRFRTVIAVEPNPIAVAILARNLQRNCLTNVQVMERAVSPKPGTAYLSKGEYLTTWGIDQRRGDSVEVESVSLDTILDSLPSVDLLKIDTEGGELDALIASAQIFKVKCVSIAARSDDAARVSRALSIHGFDAREFPGHLGSVENVEGTQVSIGGHMMSDR